MTDPTTPKQRRPGFQPGQSGNPAGRPKGARNATLLALDKIGNDNARAVLQAAVLAATGGDTTAQRILLDRLWPARKGRPVALDLPDVLTAGGVVAALAAVARAMGGGELSPDEASSVAALIEAQRRAIETTDLETRIAALEANHDPSH